jgi:hypothetical protein
MHAHLQEVLPLLDNSRSVLKAAVDQVPTTLRRTRPADDRWSVAEVLEHLAKVNRLFAEYIATSVAKARASGLGPEQQPRAPLSTDIVNKMKDRSARRQARDIVLPSGSVECDDAWADLDRSREDIRQAVLEADGLALGSVTAEHRFFGVLNVYQWVELTAEHECRHADQIREIAATVLDRGN